MNNKTIKVKVCKKCPHCGKDIYKQNKTNQNITMDLGVEILQNKFLNKYYMNHGYKEKTIEAFKSIYTSLISSKNINSVEDFEDAIHDIDIFLNKGNIVFRFTNDDDKDWIISCGKVRKEHIGMSLENIIEELLFEYVIVKHKIQSFKTNNKEIPIIWFYDCEEE